MTPTVFLVVLLAALLHAGWNALVKGGADRAAGMTALVIGHVLPSLPIIALMPFPAPASWPYLVAGAMLHVGYQVFLVRAYAAGDLTQVYPIARGVAPLLVAVVSAAVLGVAFTAGEAAAILVIAAGVASVALTRRSDLTFDPRAAGLALVTGGFIAGYSLVDGLGARVSGSPVAFFAALAILNAALVAAGAVLFRPGLLGRAVRRRREMVLGGGASFLAYALVVWAFTQAPIAHVAALRETSIVFALLIGVVVLGERFSLLKAASTFVTLAGVVLLRVAR